MSKKGFFYFALGAVAGAAGLYWLKKSGGLHFSVDIEASDQADAEPDGDAFDVVDDFDADDGLGDFDILDGLDEDPDVAEERSDSCRTDDDTEIPF